MPCAGPLLSTYIIQWLYQVHYIIDILVFLFFFFAAKDNPAYSHSGDGYTDCSFACVNSLFSPCIFLSCLCSTTLNVKFLSSSALSRNCCSLPCSSPHTWMYSHGSLRQLKKSLKSVFVMIFAPEMIMINDNCCGCFWLVVITTARRNCMCSG